MAQQGEKKYDSLWKKVDELAGKKGLTKSALTEVDKIYQLAKKEKKDGQIIKALLYQVTLNEALEDGIGNPAAIIGLEKETAATSEPVKSILKSILAEKYLNYFQQNRYKLYNRTETVNFQKNDIGTWTITDFHKKITSLYVASLQNKKLLQQTKLEPYDAIITKGNVRNLRPTLYDLLANRAFNYFRSDERDVNKPAYAFEIREEQLFSPANEFIKLAIVTNDTFSLHHKALLICQELISFHSKDIKPDALIDADINRIELLYQFGVMENKDILYVKSLNNIYDKYPSEPAAMRAAALIAQLYVNKAAAYERTHDTISKFQLIEALRICERVVQQKEESQGKSTCQLLINQIKRKELNLQTEKVNVPNQPFRTLVSFRNFTQLFLRVVPITSDLQRQLANRYDDNYWKQLAGLPSSRNWRQSFPSTNDYQRHSAEIKIDALPTGNYILLASVDENFNLDKNTLAVQYFYVSNISFINNGRDYFVLDRDNGKPLSKATIQYWNNKYDPNLRKNTLVKGELFKADDNGYVKTSDKTKQVENFQLDIRYNNDQLFMNDFQYQTYRDETTVAPGMSATKLEQNAAKVFFFTDRSIYRPAQTIFFKGIVITDDAETGKAKLFINRKAIIKLLDPNGQQVDSLQLTTNEFGSYSGSFKLPGNLINGDFHLLQTGTQGGTSFSVEEYKRPKFYAEFEKIKNAFKVNDGIIVNGFAKAYAGNNIDGASVKFRVIRKPRLIYPWLYGKTIAPISRNLEITNGVATTNSEGKFTVHFKAIPDLTLDKKLDPIFDYNIIADITDINGETRSTETTISVSYKALQLKVSIPEQNLPVDSLKNISIRTENLQGAFIPSLVHVSIYRLKSPERLIRSRFWSKPDMHVIDKATYQQLFPYDDYEDEANPLSWNRGEKLFDHIDSSKANGAFEFKSAGLTTGWYSIEVVTRDVFGEEVKDIRNIQLDDEKNIPAAVYSWSVQKDQSVEPGEKSVITIGSSAKDLFVIQHVSKHSNADKQPLTSYNYISLDSGKKTFDFPVTENDRGGFGVYHFFVKNNRFYTTRDMVNVPWTNKDLEISYESFRDKTLPGSDEKWKLNITGLKKEKVAAEMLVSMYDASLDQFKPHSWDLPGIWPTFNGDREWNAYNNFSQVQSQEKYNEPANNFEYRSNMYDEIIFFNIGIAFNFLTKKIAMAKANSSMASLTRINSNIDSHIAPGVSVGRLGVDDKIGTIQQEGSKEEGLADQSLPPVSNESLTPSIQTRKNFNETAFFLPDLKTDAEGNISFGFTIPEALTKWKFQALAHTKDVAFGYSTKDIITQKQLMVQPNAPRFFREGDHVELSTKIVNMTEKEITGTVHLELFNAANMEPLDGRFQNMTSNQYFTAEAGKSVVANFNIQIPYQFRDAVVYRFVAKSDSAKVSDGEEASLPVLTNSMLVTESLPINIQGNATKKFRFEKLLQSGSSETLQQHSLTVEFSSNPAWYAVQALPYLIEYPYECAEQTFNRFYANALATKIASASPKIKAIFEKWKALPGDKEASLVSNLEKNPELKLALLEETPWVLEAKSEAQQRKNIALLFDMIRMNGVLQSSISKLQQSQLPNGGFSWFNGGPDDRFITQYIVTGLGHLKKLSALPQSEVLDNITRLGVTYLDKRLKEDYDNLVKSKSDLTKNNTGSLQLQYLYARSFFMQFGIPGETFTAANYYRKQSQQFWLQQNKYMQGMIALALNRSGDRKTADDILKSLKQNAIVNPELGMYWKENKSGYFWYQAPVETQSLLIEAFNEISKDTKAVDDMKTWLLKQKQTQRWSSTKSTADACYALLLQGTDWLSSDPAVEIKLGSKTISSVTQQQEAGTGYFKTIFDGPSVTPSMGDITVTVSTPPVKQVAASRTGTGWGAVYWQYFENLDKITPASTPLQLSKKLFVEKNSDRGPVLEPVTDGASIKVGDKVKVRIELRVDRDMEYVQLKDMRAACMEPVNVLSSYKYQGGLGYYESTKDASTNFFFNWLPKGVYVFEYPLFATQAGNFSNGVSSIQCMYAPEFSSHSEGIRVNVE